MYTHVRNIHLISTTLAEHAKITHRTHVSYTHTNTHVCMHGVSMDIDIYTLHTFEFEGFNSHTLSKKKVAEFVC